MFLHKSESQSIPEPSPCLDRAPEIASLEISDQQEKIKKQLINRIIPELTVH